MNKNDSDIINGHYLVVFLDLLGQREKIKALYGKLGLGNKADSEKEDLINVLRSSAGTVLRFRRDLSQFFESYLEDEPNDNFPKEYLEKYKNLRKKTQINIRSFFSIQHSSGYLFR